MSTWTHTVPPKLGGHYRARNGNTGECTEVGDRIAVLKFYFAGKCEAHEYGLSGLSLMCDSWDIVACVLPPETTK